MQMQTDAYGKTSEHGTAPWHQLCAYRGREDFSSLCEAAAQEQTQDTTNAGTAGNQGFSEWGISLSQLSSHFLSYCDLEKTPEKITSMKYAEITLPQRLIQLNRRIIQQVYKVYEPS